MQNDDFVDYYDFLMVSPNADRAMIEWAVRLMLARYGKKNEQTADPKKIQVVRDAYRTLADAERRAAYDRIRQDRLGLTSPGQSAPPAEPAVAVSVTPRKPDADRPAARDDDSERTPLDKIRVELTANVEDVRYQRRIRQAVLSALYDILITRPRNPELGRAEVARTIAVQPDEIEFSIWFLRERGYIKTTTQGLYALTSEGADYVERGGVPHLAPKPAEVIDRPAGPRSAESDGPRSAAAGGPRRVL